MKQQTKICVVGYNTTNTNLIEEHFTNDALYEVERIVMEGALETGDITTVTIGLTPTVFYGTFNWEPKEQNVKQLIIQPAFLGARVGLLTVFYKGGSEDYLKSKLVGASAALPTPLQSRM